jgi:hypothetical protein
MIRSAEYMDGFRAGVVALVTKAAEGMGDTPVADATIKMADFQGWAQELLSPAPVRPGIDPE